ncbi:hypothetical protein WA026_001161 [Henosepilachna vigintioctopunctata]|uniref:Uncharacterized protein n=1 Tax=Henosepilachna vigintioctopunctata TaxID=420089 RepID=A0AAW1UZX3_9CUCU
MLEEDGVNTESITLLPPNNACGNITDEDSGDEDQLDMNNLPSRMIQNQVEVNIQVNEEDWSSEDEIPLSTLQNKEKPKNNLKAKKKRYTSLSNRIFQLMTMFFSKNKFVYTN